MRIATGHLAAWAILSGLLAGSQAASAGSSEARARLLGVGGGSLDASRVEHPAAESDCVTPVERTAIEAAREEFARSGAARLMTVQTAGAPLYEFFPMAGTLDRDIQAGNWVDLDPSPASLIWDCSNFAANGHRGVDVEVRSFAEQAIGVPVFAIADGVVSFTHDGEPDMNTQQLGQVSNLVVINHGGVRESQYFHLKNGSVAVTVGQQVRAGQQIGLTASSGNSGAPHLHLEHIDLPGNTVFEPWAGPCRPGPSGWLHQPPFDKALGLRDFGVTAENLGAIPGWPFAVPASGALAMSQQPHFIWILVANMPAGSDWSIRWIQPNGALNFQSPTFPFNNGAFFRRSWWWFNWFIFDMQSIPGTWKIEVLINGQTLVSAPIVVVPTLDPLFNRPPAPITLSFDPAMPRASNVVFCRVNTSQTLDDPDFDLVRYTYEWRVNGSVVRTLTSAALSDALPRDTAAPGQTITCQVTPGDGKVSGGVVQSSVVVAPPLCAGDANGDRVVNFADITGVLSNWQADYRPGAGPGDANGDGMVNFADITGVLSNWQATCP